MDPSFLIAHRLRKLVSEGGDQDQIGDTVRRLLELDRTAHADRLLDDIDDESVIAINRMRALP